jgi:hypothetical protein
MVRPCPDPRCLDIPGDILVSRVQEREELAAGLLLQNEGYTVLVVVADPWMKKEI